MTTRRAFLATLGGGLLAAPRAAKAQQPARMPRIGYLSYTSPAQTPRTLEAFQQGLRDLGYVEGQNLAVEYRWAEGQDDRLTVLAAELVRLNVDIILPAGGTAVTLAAMRATQTIPIIMVGTGDPVRSGLVASLARPGGNVTGFSTLRPELEGKRLEIFKQAVPRLSRVAVLRDPANPIGQYQLQQTQAAARALRITVQPVEEVRRAEDLERAFAAIVASRAQGLFVEAGRALFAHRRRIVELVASHRLPAAYPYPEYVEAGGLMSYSADYVDMYRAVGVYVDKVLKGAKPADLPVQQAAKFELVINLKTVKTLGLAIPQSVLARTDRVIQ